jgi:hypothetical protein
MRGFVSIHPASECGGLAVWSPKSAPGFVMRRDSFDLPCSSIGHECDPPSQHGTSSVTRAGKNRRFRGDKTADNDDNRDKLCRRNSR